MKQAKNTSKCTPPPQGHQTQCYFLAYWPQQATAWNPYRTPAKMRVKGFFNFLWIHHKTTMQAEAARCFLPGNIPENWAVHDQSGWRNSQSYTSPDCTGFAPVAGENPLTPFQQKHICWWPPQQSAAWRLTHDYWPKHKKRNLSVGFKLEPFLPLSMQTEVPSLALITATVNIFWKILFLNIFLKHISEKKKRCIRAKACIFNSISYGDESMCTPFTVPSKNSETFLWIPSVALSCSLD